MSLTPEQNHTLTRVENGAPMGRYLRENVWFPAVISSVLEPDVAPRPLRLLGENYVAFRSTDGRVGVFDEYCPHRGASLLLARNEDNGLRCIFHGWKFRVDGVTVEAPTQHVDEEGFCKRVPLRHFAVREAGGIVWVWLGESAPAALPNFAFMDMTGDHVCPAHAVVDFNWIQALEGLVDSAHVSILHQDWLNRIAINPKLANAQHDQAPVYEFDEMPGGFRYAAIRKSPDERTYVRITEFFGPWYTFTPGDQGSCFICVPIDETHTAFWSIRHDAREAIKDGPMKPKGDPMNWPPRLPGGREERWGQDREAMKNGSFSGFRKHFFHEDLAVAASQGAITGRTREFLNGGDLGVIRMRALLLRSVAAFEAGAEASRIRPTQRIRNTAGHGVIDNDVDWRGLTLAG